MNTNIGKLDKVIRLSIALIIGLLYLLNIITGTVAIVLGVIGASMLITSLVGICPLYSPLGINTCKKQKA
ncbi:hypothetical protein ADIS_1856 [Lunatimonas lonarensis]|uniref:Inner membrane protein YgaP-like transmembrane domain-containing protein n=1 Tax=Lunatimonas lonarensis TaxID=1232681 RepID=R7ZU97_9BACT|nr:DUF2892 domain-containing protein [Lunatimonas lonarensis]EON77637.1 hypothetical protein ADIS_1856 [Lunatimonas lonarensis]